MAFQRWGDTRAAAGKSRHETSKKGTALRALARPAAKQEMHRDGARGVAVAALGAADECCPLEAEAAIRPGLVAMRF